MTQNTKIEGVLTLVSPMHVASVDGQKGATMTQSIIADSFRTDVPYFPANDMRGRLRRKGAAIVMDAFAAKGNKIPVELYAGLTAGAASGKPSGDMTVEEAGRAGRNVYMGLFGGGLRLHRSRYAPADLLPIINSTVQAGLVPAHFGTSEAAESNLPRHSVKEKGAEEAKLVNVEGWNLLDWRHIVRVDDVMRVMREDEMKKHIAECESSVALYQQNILGNRKQRGDEKAAGITNDDVRTKKVDLDNIVNIQSIIPGTEMFVHIDLSDTVTKAQIGMAIVALRDLLNEQGLGGWVRTGFGRTKARDFQITIEGESVPLFKIDENGTVGLTESVMDYVGAMREEVSRLTVPEMLAFFVDPEKPAKKDKKIAEAA